MINTRYFLEIISNAQPRCQECVYLHRGACSLTNNDTCSCFTGYDGNLCHDEIESPPLQTTSSNNWTVPVAVVSAIAGLLLIIALVLAVLYIISRRSRQRAEIRYFSFDINDIHLENFFCFS